MRVLFVAYDIRSRMGGIQRFDQRVLRCLSELQPSPVSCCTVLSFRDESFAVDGVVVQGYQRRKGWAAIGIPGRILRGGFDLLMLDHVSISPLAPLFKLRHPRGRCLLFVHGIDVWDDPAYHRAAPIEKLCTHRFIDRIVSVSQFTAGRMQKAFAIPPDRFQLLPNAVDMDVASDVQPAAEPGRGSRIITVARLNEWGKGVGQVIGAMPLILANVPDAEYVIVGDGAIRGELEKLAREYGVESRVRFAGRVSDEELGRLYRGSAVFAMPSIKEGFGIVYLEAWKHRLPVVAGNRDASPEVVDDGVNGLVVDPGSHEQIARAITHLLVDQEYARQLGRNGYEKLRAEYSHEAFHARLQRILLGLRC